eukprot:COSAG05_NODE_3290_length_2173_cov_11.643202_1_plen_494_part_00
MLCCLLPLASVCFGTLFPWQTNSSAENQAALLHMKSLIWLGVLAVLYTLWFLLRAIYSGGDTTEVTARLGTYRVTRTRAAITVGAKTSSAKVGYLDEGDEVQGLEEKVINGRKRLRCDRGWISMRTKDGEEIMTKIETLDPDVEDAPADHNSMTPQLPSGGLSFEVDGADALQEADLTGGNLWLSRGARLLRSGSERQSLRTHTLVAGFAVVHFGDALDSSFLWLVGYLCLAKWFVVNAPWLRHAGRHSAKWHSISGDASGLGLGTYRVTRTRAAITAGAKTSSAKVGYLDEGDEVQGLEEKVINGRKRLRCDRGWISMRTKDGEEIMTKIETLDPAHDQDQGQGQDLTGLGPDAEAFNADGQVVIQTDDSTPATCNDSAPVAGGRGKVLRLMQPCMPRTAKTACGFSFLAIILNCWVHTCIPGALMAIVAIAAVHADRDAVCEEEAAAPRAAAQPRKPTKTELAVSSFMLLAIATTRSVSVSPLSCVLVQSE